MNKILRIPATRFFLMISQWSLLFFLFNIFRGYLNGDILSFVKYILFLFAVGIGIYHTKSAIEELVNHYRFKKSYSKTFSGKKVSIGYEVGSFWKVVDRYKDKEKVAVIIGVNNRFCIDRNYINPNSLISDYISSVSKKEVDEIKTTIHKQLNHLNTKQDHLIHTYYLL
ncbi:hypothetical protein C772_02501 [Bhargavaea cecembensis DSE10]|uniref:Uncharacterized protein n=1 Tax=Bhargavaea cecembensis DSE10 TaxID=1235279 RepID=M7P4S2_9BACL|nr:hypothetical protein [Bhargavaea cecembensis]EMR05529.1 hypothetical protein C772_02501 [Bhargavaea cecembensis DSE10]